MKRTCKLIFPTTSGTTSSNSNNNNNNNTSTTNTTNNNTTSTTTNKTLLKKILLPIDIESDYQRMYIQDMNWRMNDINQHYNLCKTYPNLLIFPGCIENENILNASYDRSIHRLPTLVWLHPYNKAPLCRAAQPLSGMSGNTIEQDKNLLLAIKNSCPTNLPLRIADARPKLNANANAVQGKGFENINYLGGSSIATIVFMDIDNIHVVRHSLAKLRESIYSNINVNNENNNSNSNTAPTTIADGSTIYSSKWTAHIASILKGSVGVADSLMLGHPVLVHCSDGW